MEYIIIYNAETDFIRVYTKEQVQSEIGRIIADGYASDEIELYEAEQLSFEIEGADIKINVIGG